MPVLVATLKAKEGKEAELEAVTKELVAKVIENEEGCLLYLLCRGETPGTLVILERYRDQEALDAHRKTEHYRTLGQKMGEFMAGRPEVVRLREV